jgi:hypothetical protein
LFQYWNDLLSVGSWLTEEQMLRMAGVVQRSATGEDGPNEWPRELAKLWWGWASMMTGFASFPAEWMARRCASTPTLAFAIDSAAQSTEPQAAPAAIDAHGLALGATNLQRWGSPGSVDASHVQVKLLDRGARVQVTLVNLGGDANADGNDIPPGIYTGMAYAYERPNLRPLAIVVLYVEPDDESAPKAKQAKAAG